MGSRYPHRESELNMNNIIGVRILPSQREKLDDYSKKHKIKLSEIMREAITMWLNMNNEEK